MIEIEKKFLLTDTQRESLLADATKLDSKIIEDSYYDTDDYSLTSRDYWLRLRDGVFELKAPLGHRTSTATNQYHELTETADIVAELDLSDSDDFESALASAGIHKFITCYSDRTSYEKQGFHIDIDAVSFADSEFTYNVAEIELLVESESDAGVAEARIIELARSLYLTTDAVILGKVLAYLQVENPDHYNALVAAGVV